MRAKQQRYRELVQGVALGCNGWTAEYIYVDIYVNVYPDGSVRDRAKCVEY